MIICIIVIVNLEQRFFFFNDQLRKVCNTLEDLCMQHKPVSKTSIENPPLLEASVHSFVSCSGYRSHALTFIIEACRGVKVLIAISVSTISQHHFTNSELVNKPIASDSKIGPRTTGERTIGPHNIASLNGNADLIPKTRALELVREPTSIKWSLFVDAVVCPIDCNLTNRSVIAYESVFPIAL